MKLSNITDLVENTTGVHAEAPTVLEAFPKNEITDLIIGKNLAKPTALMLLDAFMPFHEQYAQISKKVRTLVVTNSGEVDLMNKAREARMALRQIRLAADKERIELKRDALSYGNTVQAVFNTLAGLIEPLEEELKFQEDFKKREEAERIGKLVQAREDALNPYCELRSTKNFNLANMEEGEFDTLLTTLKLAHEAKIEAAAKAAAEAEAAAIEAKKQEAIRFEKEKAEAIQRGIDLALQREAAERDAQAKAEREALWRARQEADNAIAQMEQAREAVKQAREALEAERLATKQAEEERQRIAREKEAEAVVALATRGMEVEAKKVEAAITHIVKGGTDAANFLALADELEALFVETKTEAGKKLAADVFGQIKQIINLIRYKSNNL
jgi:hypothetical protein